MDWTSVGRVVALGAALFVGIALGRVLFGWMERRWGERVALGLSLLFALALLLWVGLDPGAVP